MARLRRNSRSGAAERMRADSLEAGGAGQKRKMLEAGGIALDGRGEVDEVVILRGVGLGLFPDAARGVGLGVEVDEQDLVAGEGEGGGEIDGGSGLSDAAFLVSDSDYCAHGVPSVPRGTLAGLPGMFHVEHYTVERRLRQKKSP